MIAGLTWLVGFQLLGEVIVRAVDAPVPGPVVGMLLLFGWLRLGARFSLYDGSTDAVTRAGTVLLRHLQLLFVPAGVGVVAYAGVVGRDALPIGAALLGSWLVGLVVVGWVAVVLERVLGKEVDPL